MSWQTYVDELVEAGLEHGAIIDTDGNTMATSKGFSLKDGEGKAIVESFATAIGVIEVIIAGVKYKAHKDNPTSNSIYGVAGVCGAVLVKTATTIVIGIYDGKMQPEKAAIVVENLANYLKENGY